MLGLHDASPFNGEKKGTKKSIRCRPAFPALLVKRHALTSLALLYSQQREASKRNALERGSVHVGSFRKVRWSILLVQAENS
jgi:hypothetical protein